MAKSQNLNLTQDLAGGAVAFVNADAASTLKTLITADADGEIVKGIQIASDDTSARVLDFLINYGAGDIMLCSVSVPASSGTNGTTAAVDALAAALQPGLPLDALGKRVLPLKPNAVLKVRNQTQVTAAKTVSVAAFTEQF